MSSGIVGDVRETGQWMDTRRVRLGSYCKWLWLLTTVLLFAVNEPKIGITGSKNGKTKS